MWELKVLKLGALAVLTTGALIGDYSGERATFLPDILKKPSQSVLAQDVPSKSASQIFEAVNPAVVTVKNGLGHGSGFIVNQEGLIITNAHVVDNGPSVVTVVFADGRQASADVIGFAKEELDLAALKIYQPEKLPILKLAHPNSVKVGDRVFAIGTPLDPAFQNSFTQGNVTKIDRDRFNHIQHDAAIFSGNSGGPLLNEVGEVIGVNARGIGSDYEGPGQLNSGFNFAIPVEQVLSFITAVKQENISPVSTLPKAKPSLKITKLALNGSTISDSLSAENKISLYMFEGRVGQEITIDMVSEEINSNLMLYKILLAPDKKIKGEIKIAENDDLGPGNLNARIKSTLKEDGIYLNVAKSASGEYGTYNLKAFSRINSSDL